MARELGEIRQSQAVTTYAPGSIVDMRAQGADGAPVSVVMAGLDDWDQHASDTGLHLERAKELHIRQGAT